MDNLSSNENDNGYIPNGNLYYVLENENLLKNENFGTLPNIENFALQNENSCSLVENNPDLESLEQYLKRNSGGKVILLAYKNIGNVLTNNHRTNLVRMVIEREIERALRKTSTQIISKFHIKPQRFIELAKEIVRLFPSENEEIYYTKFETVTSSKGEKIRKPARGKLLDHYDYQKRVLIESKILVPPIPEMKENTKDTDTNITPPEIYNHHEWLLQGNLEPENDVIENWNTTFYLRKQDKITAAEYMKKYPCLKSKLGIRLISMDFEKLHPGKQELFATKWPLLREKLLEKLLKTAKFVILHNTAEQQDAAIIVLLPKLMRPPPIKRKHSEKVKKPSIIEIENSFIITVSNPGDINKSIEDTKKAGAPVQPFLLFVGSEREGFHSFYVIVDDVKFQLMNAFEALDLAFKIFFTFNLEYPVFSYHIWQIIQIAGYNIREVTQKIGNQLNILLSELKV